MASGLGRPILHKWCNGLLKSTVIVEELQSPVPSKKTSFEELLICIFLAKEAAFEVFVCQIFDEEVEARSELLLSIV